MEHDEIASMLNSVEFFDILNDEQMKLLAFASERKNFRAGEILLEKGEKTQGAYIINQGFILVGDDLEKAQRMGGPSLLIGELSLLVQKVQHVFVSAQTSLECLFIPRSAFQKLLKQSPELAELLSKKIENNLDKYLLSLKKFKNT